jgi:hypothetical protein
MSRRGGSTKRYRPGQSMVVTATAGSRGWGQTFESVCRSPLASVALIRHWMEEVQGWTVACAGGTTGIEIDSRFYLTGAFGRGVSTSPVQKKTPVVIQWSWNGGGRSIYAEVPAPSVANALQTAYLFSVRSLCLSW